MERLQATEKDLVSYNVLENKESYRRMDKNVERAICLNLNDLSNTYGAAAGEKGEIRNACRSHDVTENKVSPFNHPTMFMKTGMLLFICHDVDEKKGVISNHEC